MSLELKRNRYSYLPIQHPNLERYFTSQYALFWVPEDIDFSEDRWHWDTLDNDTQKFLKFILCFFSQADGIINENLIENFQKEVSERYKEAQYFYTAQAFFETIHNKTYSMLIETFIRDPREKDEAFNAIQTFPVIGKIADWMMGWMDSSKPLTERVVAFACIEGILFNGAFVAIYWIKKKGVLPGLCTSNELIARDEALHTLFGEELFRTLVEDGEPRPTQERIHKIVKSAMDTAEEFIREALGVGLIGMKPDDMVKYVQCTADTLLEELGYSKYYNVEDPFPWMASISLPNKTNFFERKVTEYKKSIQGEESHIFDLNVDF